MQLLRLRPAFEGTHVTYVTVRRSYSTDIPGEDLRVVPDATRWNKFKLLVMATRILWLVATIRPDVIISTGAAPGYFAIRFGGWFGARTCWVDSIANAEELSLSGRKIRSHATRVLSQWPDVAAAEGVEHAGSVL
ncbi:MAG: UDP-N-acetylglucosamine--LPS N-acetylglucosamine transferase [Phycisphaerae bacterium]|nr:UDP-N-acetylglucosamine--LPS N-acetylglucosamine transferase [Phycisphaerae bacterium]